MFQFPWGIGDWISLPFDKILISPPSFLVVKNCFDFINFFPFYKFWGRFSKVLPMYTVFLVWVCHDFHVFPAFFQTTYLLLLLLLWYICFTYAFLCCGMFYFQFGYASYCLRLNESSHKSLEWLISWLTKQVIGSRYESLVVIRIVFTWYKRVVSWLYSLVKLYTTKLLLHSLIPKLLPKGYLGLRKGLERTTDLTFIMKDDQVITQVSLQMDPCSIFGCKIEGCHYGTTTRPIPTPTRRRLRWRPIIPKSSRRTQHPETDLLWTIQPWTSVEKRSHPRTMNHSRTNRYWRKFPNDARVKRWYDMLMRRDRCWHFFHLFQQFWVIIAP